MRTPHPRLKVKERMRVLSPRSCVDRAVFLPDEKTEAAFEPGSMPVLTATGSWLFDFQPSDACRLATLRLLRRRVIRQKNGADTFYTLHTSRSSGGLLLTNEELRHVASRRREVRIPVQKPFRG